MLLMLWWMDGQKNNVALAHPYHEGKACITNSGQCITKTCLYNVDPLKPQFYIHVIKLRFTGVYIIFLIFALNVDCGYSLEPPCRGSSNGYPQSMF